MTLMDYTPYIEKVLDIARAEIGYLEKLSPYYLDEKTRNAGDRNYTKYARDLDALKTFYNTPKQGAAWCDVFVDWCFVQAFGADAAKKMLYQPDKSLGAGVKYSAQYYRNSAAWYATPQRGDQIFFGNKANQTYTHTGIVEKIVGNTVYTIEGNTSNSSGVVINGGGVYRKTYALSSAFIVGYGRPKWEIAAAQNPNNSAGGSGAEIDLEKLIAALMEHLTAEQCYAIMLKGNDFAKTQPLPTTWDAAGALQSAIDHGITDGSNPMQFIPRYQAAIMADRGSSK